jgi:hypothetical protein
MLLYVHVIESAGETLFYILMSNMLITRGLTLAVFRQTVGLPHPTASRRVTELGTSQTLAASLSPCRERMD